jgi:hypothetical protein
MHAVEQLLCFSSALVHPFVPSNPTLRSYQVHSSGSEPLAGHHLGFDSITPAQKLKNCVNPPAGAR